MVPASEEEPFSSQCTEDDEISGQKPHVHVSVRCTPNTSIQGSKCTLRRLSQGSFSKELVLVIEPTESTIAQNPALFTVDDDDESKKEKRQLNHSARIHFDANATQFGRASREAPLFRGMDDT